MVEDNPLLQYLTPELLGGINESGGTMYQTGGSLRDSYIGGLDSKDLDLLVHGMDKEELGDLLQQHGDVDFVGAQHGVFKFRPHGMEGEPFDIGVPRREVSTGEGHSDYEMSFDKDMPLEDEQLRRDFWMNAMMRNIHTGELHDIDGRGLHDIKNQQISVVNPNAFSEDPLRMLRAVQFASRFGFNIEPETLKHIQDSAHKINTVHPDRFNAEFLKLFEKSKRPSDGVDLLHQTGITNHILHDAQSTEIMNHIPKSAYGAFLAEMAQNYGDDAKEYLQSALNISNKDAITAQAVIDWKNNQPLNNNWDVVQFYNKIRGDPYIMHNIDAHSHASEIMPLSSQLDYIREQGIPTNLKELNVNGKDLMNLGYRGIEIGNSLNELFEYAVRNQTNDKEHLLSLASEGDNGDYFGKGEAMDFAWRLLKDISQGYSSVILNEPEQMLSMVDELGIRGHLPPDFTHEEGRFPHHMTLNMGHLPKGWEHGQPVDLTIDGWGIVNEPKAQAMAFRVNRESLPAPIDEERTPHISTMVGPNGKPIHSNQIVEWNDIEPFNVKGLVSGKSEKKSEPMDLAWRLLKEKKPDPRLKAAGVSGYNKPKRTPNHPKKSHVVVARSGGKVKTIRFGEQGADTVTEDNPKGKRAKKRASFKARHQKNIKRGPMSAAYWADKVKW